MNEIHTEIVINAPKEIIWGILTDFPAYPDWNPFIVKVLGSAAPGKRVFFVARFKIARAPVLAKILQFEVNQKLSWGGPGIRLAGRIFCAEHFFGIEEIQPGQCRFINSEQMGGVAGNTLWPLIERGRPAYIAMNEALKARAEGLEKAVLR